MKHSMKLIYAIMTVAMLVFTIGTGLNPVFADTGKDYGDEVDAAIDAASEKVLEKGVHSAWTAIGIAAAGIDVPKSYDDRLSEMINLQISDNLDGGRIKITDIERLAIATAAIGKDPTNVESLNLIEMIYNSKKWPSGSDSMTAQGNNGPIYALIALDTKNFTVPSDAKWTRDKLIEELLSNQNDDGSWALFGDTPNIDITAMAMIGLSTYKDQPEVKKALDNAVDWLSSIQEKEAGFDGGSFVGGITSEAASQVVIGLTAYGIDPAGERFSKNDEDVISHLLGYQTEDGGFKHTRDASDSNAMATEQALQALAAYKKFLNNDDPLYHFGESNPSEPPEDNEDPDPEPDPDPNPPVEDEDDNQVNKGKTHQVPDSLTSVHMPDDLPDGTTLDVKPFENDEVKNPGIDRAGDMFTFTFNYPNGQTPEEAFQLTMGIDESLSHPGKTAIYYLNEDTNEWTYVGGKVDTNTQTITLDVDHFSTYGVFADTKAPSDLTAKASDIQTDRVVLEFSAKDMSGIKTFSVYRAGELLEELDGSDKTYTDSTVKPGTTYEYEIAATDNLGNTVKMIVPVTTPKAAAIEKDPSDDDEDEKQEGTPADNNDNEGDNGENLVNNQSEKNMGDQAEVANSSDQKGQTLPKTASNMFNYLTAGLILLVIGLVISGVYFYRRKKVLN